MAIGWPIRRTGILLVVAAAALAGCTAGAKSVSTGASAGTTPATAGGTWAPPLSGTTSVGSVLPAPSVTDATGAVVTRPASRTTLAPATTPRITRPSSAAPASISLSSADFGKTVRVHVNDSVRLTLDDAGMRWGAVIVSPSGPLRPDPAPAPPPNGQLAIWTAVRPATVTVMSTRTAGCTPPRACAMYLVQFQLTIVIS